MKYTSLIMFMVTMLLTIGCASTAELHWPGRAGLGGSSESTTKLRVINGCSKHSHQNTFWNERFYLRVRGQRLWMSETQEKQFMRIFTMWYAYELKQFVIDHTQFAKSIAQYIRSINDWRVTLTRSGMAIVYRDGWLLDADNRQRRYAPHGNHFYDDNEPLLADYKTGIEAVQFKFIVDDIPIRFGVKRTRCKMRNGRPVLPYRRSDVVNNFRVRRILNALQDEVELRFGTGLQVAQ